ncbi:hypothetical protein [Alteromonas sp. H39]|uniref:hypothetical protein n=1 Tax=Alteromonas sp. H39 TaxID=3389876 RepID=UPI0039E1E330
MEMDFNLTELLTLISEKFDSSFFVSLAKEPLFNSYIYGGLVRSLVLGYPWKDVDLRIIIDADWDKRELTFESFLQSHGDTELKRRFEHADFTLYRFRPQGSTERPLDITLSNRIDVAPSDYTINSVFADLKSGKLLDPYNGLLDIKSKTIRSIKKPSQLILEEPWAPFRAVKSACHMGFTIVPELKHTFKSEIKCIRQPLAYISENKSDLWAETQLANLFSGLKANPRTYLKLSDELGIIKEVILYFSEKMAIRPFQTTLSTTREITRETQWERLISAYLKGIALAIEPNQPRVIFNYIVQDLALNQVKTYGEIDISPARINYI